MTRASTHFWGQLASGITAVNTGLSNRELRGLTLLHTDSLKLQGQCDVRCARDSSNGTKIVALIDLSFLFVIMNHQYSEYLTV
jgi:hypothetical protein